MNNKTITAVVIGLIIGISGTVGVTALTDKDEAPQTSTTQQQIASTDHSSMTMKEMNKELEVLSGDAFDKTFIEMMTAHHEGAIDMAKLIPSRAKHAEIKKLGEEIIAAQTKEISDMRQWMMDWGYGSGETTDSMPGMSH